MRFGFGKNWKSYISGLTPERIAESRKAIAASFQSTDFTGLRVLDIGSGSGLSSLAFLQMGADVTAFDYDIDSVECTQSLLASHATSNMKWQVMRGSVLDPDFMASLGTFDIVYSWGVLHHTGAMWQALDNAASAVGDCGTFLIALYNDQGVLSKFWKVVKWLYCSSWLGRFAVKAIFYPIFFAYSIFQDVTSRKAPLSHFKSYYQSRGMSIVHDWDDWLGGYPFEVASEATVTVWAKTHAMAKQNTRLTNGLGCNEFVLRKIKVQ